MSTAIATEDLHAAVYGETTVIVSASQRQASELLRKAVQLLPLVTVAADGAVRVDKQSAEAIELSTGGRVISLPASAATIQGYTGHVVIDEAAWIPDVDSLWMAIVPTISTSSDYRLSVVSTPGPRAGMFHRLWSNGDNAWSRRQPLIVHITTADFDRESICNEKYDYACKVRDGVIDDPAFLPVIYEASNDDDWTDPDIWKRVNPNLGVSINKEYLQRECRKAQETPSYENTFKRLHLNIRTQQDVRWLSLEAWDACDGSPIDESALEGRPCFAGLDLSTTTDLSALVLVFPHDDGTSTLVPRFWVPADNAERRERRDRVPYQTWARQGLIEMTPGNVIDYDRIKARIDELGRRFDIREIAVDRWNATQLITQLQDEWHEVTPFGQGFKDMSAPTKEFERLVMSRRLRHGGYPVLRWMVSHVSVETDAGGNLKPSKKKSTDRIDGLVAAIMALSGAMQEPDPKSPYDEPDALFL